MWPHTQCPEPSMNAQHHLPQRLLINTSTMERPVTCSVPLWIANGIDDIQEVPAGGSKDSWKYCQNETRHEESTLAAATKRPSALSKSHSILDTDYSAPYY